MKRMMDVNCDLGEGLKTDKVLMPLIDSCNVACGGHSGDRISILSVLKDAKEHQVSVGAHPSYPDVENFGRITMNIPTSELVTSIREQISLFLECCQQEEITCHHIKFHGALYNQLVHSQNLSEELILLLKELTPDILVYAPWQSVFAKVAEHNGFKVWYEVFADRNYLEDLSLVPRKNQEAILKIEDVKEHVSRMVDEGIVRTTSGVEVPIAADTICIHGDHDNALEVINEVRKVLNR